MKLRQKAAKYRARAERERNPQSRKAKKFGAKATACDEQLARFESTRRKREVNTETIAKRNAGGRNHSPTDCVQQPDIGHGYCEHCGSARMSKSARFCGNCGHAFVAGVDSTGFQCKNEQNIPLVPAYYSYASAPRV